ncbi:MAG: hypothetical protein NVS4B11_03590 [Ktedonobacteraceae bacterium]
MWKQYEAARGGCARVALLVGELGIGKTRLLDEFAACAIRDGATVLRGGASESEGMPPYLPFLEALGQHIRVTPLHKLPEQIAVAPQILASILPELTARLGEVPLAYPLLPEQTRLRLYEAVGMFLEAISTPQVLVLTLDDLHWADTSSLDLLCYIARHHSKAKLLIVGTYREGEVDGNPALERAVTELARQRILTKVAVDPLSADEIEALAVSYLGSSISPTLGQLLYAQSEGNPFFAEELIQGWIEMRALVQVGEHWVVVAPLEHSLPQSIVGALRQRFTRLSSDIIDHLRIAAVIGRTFDLSLLATVEGQEVEAIEERLLEAERARLVRADQMGVFRFNHDKIRECLYAEVSTSRRQRLHEAIGRVLEARYEKESTKSTYQLAELAFHFTRSGDRSQGATYSLLAAEQFLQSSASKEAMIHYQIALTLLDSDDSRRGTVLLGLGEAALLAGAASEAVVAYEAALTWLLRSGDQEAAAQAAHKLGLAQWRQEAPQAARAALEHALALLGNSLSAEVVRVLVDSSMLLTIDMSQQAEGTAYAQQALAMARRLEDKSLEATANRVVAVNLCVSGNDIATALQSLERTLALAEASGDSCEAAECCLYLMLIRYWMAEIRHSEAVSLRCIEFAKHCRQQYQLRYASSQRALLLASQGAWAKAEQAIEQTLTFVDNQPGPSPLAFLHQIRGFLAYQQEEYVAAEQEFQVAVENQQRGSGGLICSTSLLGLVQIALGKREDASTYMAELEVLLAGLPVGSLPTSPIMICLALMAIALNDQERVVKLYPRLVPFRGKHYWFLVDRVLGEMATLCRDWEMAMLHLSAAEATAQREGLRPELARTLVKQADFEVTRGGQGSDTRARDLLNRSLVLFEELNMIDSVGRVRRRLRTLSHKLDDPTRRSLPADLTRREADVLQLVVEGKINRQIAQELGISEKTVANHLSHIFNKTSSENRAAATAFAIRHGLA